MGALPMSALDEVLGGFLPLCFEAGRHSYGDEEIARRRAEITAAARVELEQLRAQVAALEQQRAELEAQYIDWGREPGSQPQASVYTRLLRQSALAEQLAALWRRYGQDKDLNLHGLLPASLRAALDALVQPIGVEPATAEVARFS